MDLIISDTGGSWGSLSTYTNAINAPTSIDNVIGTPTSGPLIMNINGVCRSLDLRNSSSKLTFNSNVRSLTTYGVTSDGFSVVLNDDGNIGDGDVISGSGVFNINSGNSKLKLSNRTFNELNISGSVDSLSLSSELILVGGVNISSLTSNDNTSFYTNGWDIMVSYFSTNNVYAYLYFGSSSITFTANNSTYPCFNTISYGSITIMDQSNSIYVETANTSRKLVDVTTPNTLNFNNVFLSSSDYPLLIERECNINKLILDVGTWVKFSPGRSYTIKSLEAFGSEGAPIKLSSTSLVSPATIIKPSGITSTCDWLDITDVRTDGITKWYAGSNSYGNGDVTGWLFEDYISSTTDTMMLGFVC